MRYVNVIDLQNGNPLDWTQYLDDHMLCLFKFHKESEPLARVFSSLEFNFDDCFLKYQFGIANPDYPAPIKRKQFVLDLDASYQGLLAGDEISRSLDLFHDRIEEFFEMSIKDDLRNNMNA